MLLDPFEEQFYLLAAAVQLGDRQRRQGEVVGQEDEALKAINTALADTPEKQKQE